VRDRPRAVPWLLVIGSALLALLLVYVLFGAYVPAKQHIARLEAELKEVYAREADLHRQVADLEERLEQRDKQLGALRGQPGRGATPRPAAPARQTRPVPRRLGR
jgi:hypothetical protein